MKIVYCIPSCYNSGGMERVLSVKANYLADKMNYEIVIVTTGQGNRKPYFDHSSKIQFVDLDVNYNEIETLPIYRKWFILKDKRILHKKRLKDLLYKIKADIVVSMFTHETSFLYKIKDGSFKILELHFSKHFRDLHNKYNHASLFIKIIGKVLNYRDFLAAKKYDKFVVLTEEDKRNWKGFSNIEAISNPIFFVADEKADYHSHQVIAVGRLCAQKGFDFLIPIWASIDVVLREQWHLTIYGSGPDYNKLINLIEHFQLSDSVTIHQPIKDIKTVYKESSILCFTSRYEGFGLALMEAMSCGLACISFDCPCGPSEIISDNRNGILVQSFDTKTFAVRLMDLMHNELKRKALGENAYSSIRHLYSEDVIMQKWVTLFSQLAK